ncbi:MAG TPA: M3 family metallopeptidase [Caproiciproducens sp.]|nr:M3 family metallopeptidase [Caproiciproducens sp.]
MYKYHELNYSRPDYQEEQKKLMKYKNKMSRASSCDEIRRLWISMKESAQYVRYMEQYAYTCFLNGISFDFMKDEIRIINTESQKLDSLQNDCDRILLNSPYIKKFSVEYGDVIVNNLRNNILLSSEQTSSLQARDFNLRAEYTALLANEPNNEETRNKCYRILDELIKVRSEIAKTLGFNNYVEMGYRLHNRVDYGINDIVNFRSQIQKLITPVCAELRKSETINYPKVNISSGDALIAFIKDMFSDISSDSGEYIKFMLDHELYDIHDRPNKRPNYFSCCMHPYIKAPFIIGCFHGNGLEVSSLIHEFGHGYAFYSAARSQKIWEYHRAVTSINEVHSKSMEHFAYPYLDKLLENKKREYIHNHLFHSCDNLPYRCAIDEFEHALYTDINLSRIQRCELWAEIEKKYMPWRICDSESVKRGAYWPNQPHIFTHPFYYIEYDIAQISVFEFYKRSKENYRQAWKDYSNLCHAGGSKNYLELLKIGNLASPFSNNAVEKICKPVLNELLDSRW